MTVQFVVATLLLPGAILIAQITNGAWDKVSILNVYSSRTSDVGRVNTGAGHVLTIIKEGMEC